MYVVFAPNVRAGGGLVLLQALLSSWAGPAELCAVLDKRAKSKLVISPDIAVNWVDAGLLGRLHAERQLATTARTAECILCFHGLPPVFARKYPSARVVVFLQNRLVIERGSLRDYPLRTRLRILLERFLFRQNMSYVSSVIVQGQGMAGDLAALLAGRSHPQIHVRPFAAFTAAVPPLVAERRFDFIYPASGEPHKNHERLLIAWEYLKQDGIAPSLALTLGPRDDGLWRALQLRADRAGLNVTNLGHVSRDVMIEAYGQARALIFPSTKESFGLPLVEATSVGLPIIASELDYVRDVCEPVESFDPSSPVSIARAVKRHLGKPEDRATVATPDAFWTALIADCSGS
jgi:glycosyltransferase involved in cell wall biosynthesis